MMGNVTVEGVQKLLKIHISYNHFPTWEEDLEFEVDGVQVKAVATHAWRGESVRILEPFVVDGSVYSQQFFPPLFGLGSLMLSRSQSLAENGLTERDGSICMATTTYRRHAAYLRIKAEVDFAQEAFYSDFREELAKLLSDLNMAKVNMRQGRLVIRRQLHAQQIDQKQYIALLKPLNNLVKLCDSEYNQLFGDISRELEKIKQLLIDKELAQ